MLMELKQCILTPLLNSDNSEWHLFSGSLVTDFTLTFPVYAIFLY